MVNKLIEEKLNSLGIEVLGYSKKGENLKEFSSQYKVPDNLFSFIVENNLNRYLFSFFMREGTLDLEKISFNHELLKKNEIKDLVKKSFIKKITCKTCDNLLLYREHQRDINPREKIIKKCPLCQETYSFSFFDLEDDFSINLSDLSKYLKNLSRLGVIKEVFFETCLKCNSKKEVDLDGFSLSCKNDFYGNDCGGIKKIGVSYVFEDPFLNDCLINRDGSWFEWFISHIFKYIYEIVECNIEISYRHNELTKKTEIDVICLDKEGELHIFECKDYLHRKPSLTEMENLFDLSELFNDVSFISSYKIDKKSQDKIEELCSNPPNFIIGTKLEEQFMSEESILGFLEENPSGTIRLYPRLPLHKRYKILEDLVIKIIDEKLLDNNNSYFLRSLLEELNYIRDMDLNKIRFEEIINLSLGNLENNLNVENSIKIIHNLSKANSLEKIIEKIGVEEFLLILSNYLVEDSSIGYNERKPSFYLINEILDKLSNFSQLNKRKMSEFLLKFIPMFDVYYGHRNRRETLRKINLFWGFADEDCKDKILIIFKDILKNQSELWNKANEIAEFLVDNYNTFSLEQKKEIKAILSRYVSEEKEDFERVRNHLYKIENF